MNEIQLNTLLGNFWEQVVAKELTALRVKPECSPSLGAGIISPDFVCRKQKTTFFVTCTGSSQSFIKKRWRYINELFQAKAVLGGDMLVANLVLATDSNLQEFEQIVFKKLFDLAAFGNEFPDFDKHYLWARSELSSGVDVSTLSKDFRKRASAKHFRTGLRDWLKNALVTKPTKLAGLWAEVARYQAGRILTPIVPNDSTYWRWACLKLLPLTDAERKAVIVGMSGKTIKADAHRLKYAGVETKHTIAGLRVADPELQATLKGFTGSQLLETLQVLDADNASIRFPIQEVVDEYVVKGVYAHYKPAFVTQASFVSMAQTEFKDAKADRIRVWEYAVALANTSLLDINKDYVKKWGGIIVANPINNIILKTDIGLAIAKVANIDDVIRKASGILWNRLPAKVTESLFVGRVMDYRKRSLFLQPYLNPTQRRFEAVCKDVLKVNPEVTSFDGLLGDIGIKGRASRVEAIYVLKFKRVRWIFKVLSGYKGGYEHKADEMASRAWLLRFRIDAKTGKAFAAPVRLAFVYEGEWDEKYLSLLHASGWDEIIHLSAVERFLSALPK